MFSFEDGRKNPDESLDDYELRMNDQTKVVQDIGMALAKSLHDCFISCVREKRADVYITAFVNLLADYRNMRGIYEGELEKLKTK